MITLTLSHSHTLTLLPIRSTFSPYIFWLTVYASRMQQQYSSRSSSSMQNAETFMTHTSNQYPSTRCLRYPFFICMRQTHCHLNSSNLSQHASSPPPPSTTTLFDPLHSFNVQTLCLVTSTFLLLLFLLSNIHAVFYMSSIISLHLLFSFF